MSRRSLSGRAVKILAMAIERVEGDEDRRRGDDARIGMLEQFEAGAELLIEDRHLAVKHERRHAEERDRRGDVAEPARVVDAVAAEQAYAGAILIRENPPAVDLLLIDPAGTVEGLGDERGLHRRVLR